MLFLTGLLLVTSATATPRIILDTDFGSDVDDAGALAMLNPHISPAFYCVPLSYVISGTLLAR